MAKFSESTRQTDEMHSSGQSRGRWDCIDFRTTEPQRQKIIESGTSEKQLLRVVRHTKNSTIDSVNQSITFHGDMTKGNHSLNLYF